jgi:glycosyltransferase involved in cell wall biosynthesis
MSAGRLPVVSVIVPTYQRRESVQRAVRSVLAQTFRDFELIVVDDGSRDGTRASLAALGDSITYIWQENRGVSAARNAGLERARGELVAFLDSDDRWLPEHLTVMVALLRRHPEAVLASSSRAGGALPVGRSVSRHPHPSDRRLP